MARQHTCRHFVLVIFALSLVFQSCYAAAGKPALSIDVAKKQPPISRYIYGQFIEHLGRCIYGGIWAEMLQDRKFYYPVGSKPSPWKIIGPAEAVSMDTNKPFVGKHSPRLQLRSDDTVCGIAHGELGLVKDKDYTGRIILKATGSVQVSVSLVWGPGPEDRQSVTISELSDDYRKKPLRFTAAADTDQGRLEITARGNGTLWIGTLSLMPADNIHAMRRDTLQLLKELNAPIYRWPGGNFVSGYDWRDGIGDRDKRPPRKNPAWQGIEHNDFGLDEFIVFCREVGAEPLIVVNTGFGDAHSAAEEVEYANGSVDTPMGRWRAANGHPEPYRVKWWGVGNEMYGRWQLGHMSLDHYVRKHNLFAEAMRKVDPTIKLIAVGNVGPWSEGMLKHCSDHMDLISEHFYRGAKESVLEHVKQAPDAVRRIVSAHRRYRETIDALKGKDIDIAIDEWNYWYGSHIFGELGTRYFMRDALGIAAGLHEMIRNSDIVFMANYAQTVNVIGAIKTSKTAASFETTGLVLKLYRNHFGQIPVQLSGQPSPLDCVAAVTKDGDTLTLGIVNPADHGFELPLSLQHRKLSPNGAKLWRIAHSDPMAYNEPGKKPRVTIERYTLSPDDIETLKIAPYSVNIFELPLR